MNTVLHFVALGICVFIWILFLAVVLEQVARRPRRGGIRL